ncbi:MAG: tRNA uridine-5-carboxymethylaminomethyl(34) synthesis enzyme MnmG [Fibrobacter sp.]|nr:tRNA uridine-5-carboxymethylaminomethyl(34) synthesis enzyme MnmG [Fibrobacter sp.]
MNYDIIVVGGGHAGIEAANIPTKRKLKVLLITSHLDLIGQMSCNPSIGGIAKGNIVREINAMGGLMAQITDKAGIHFRMLNKSKGTAVWGNRAQADKVLYRSISKKIIEENQYIDILQAFVYHIMNDGKKCIGVIIDSGKKIYAKAVVLCMGTFLNGVAHIGLNEFPSGRTGEPPSIKLTDSINEYGIKSGRLKTGTSPRIDGRTVDYSKWEIQGGDDNPWPFSFFTKEKIVNRVTCWTSRTNNETHSIIKENLSRSPLYSGKIKSIGPRYCPSIEDKIVKFGDREGHSLFLEPESLSNSELYLNGLSTSLPYDVQEKMVHSIDGLEYAKILRPGYGIEYDYFPPTQLKSTLESKVVENLYFAGQINGTSGYEEAACQGLIAGVNASQKILNENEIILKRDSSYAAVLIDDLVTKGTEEPYRMFTSRAEYRILLRQDNSDERLMPLFYKCGYIDKEKYELRENEWHKRKTITEVMKSRLFYINEICNNKEESTQKYKMSELLKRPEISLTDFKNHVDFIDFSDEMLVVSIESDIKYEGFISKQKDEIERNEKLESTVIPDEFDYDSVKGLLNESRIKMQNIRPYTLGQASRIPGVTPADISILTMHLIKFRHLKSFT